MPPRITVATCCAFSCSGLPGEPLPRERVDTRSIHRPAAAFARKPAEPAEHLSLELRRGAIVIAILSRLRQPLYGYSLREQLAEQGLEIKEGTLYPLLRRLESQRLLDSDWDVGGGRPRRYYRLSREGKAVLSDLRSEWEELVKVLARLLAEE
jgi:DNA-binding PadR family transcriptional regulator